jgi:hypothetical protein
MRDASGLRYGALRQKLAQIGLFICAGASKI